MVDRRRLQQHRMIMPGSGVWLTGLPAQNEKPIKKGATIVAPRCRNILHSGKTPTQKSATQPLLRLGSSPKAAPRAPDAAQTEPIISLLALAPPNADETEGAETDANQAQRCRLRHRRGLRKDLLERRQVLGAV